MVPIGMLTKKMSPIPSRDGALLFVGEEQLSLAHHSVDHIRHVVRSSPLALINHMCVFLRHSDILVAQQLLYVVQTRPALDS